MTRRILTFIALLSASAVSTALLFTDAPETLGRLALIGAALYALGSAGVVLAHEQWRRA